MWIRLIPEMVKKSRRDDLHYSHQTIFTQIAKSKKQQVVEIISVLAIGVGIYFSSFERYGRYMFWNPIFGASEVSCPYE
ncbi:hypothetical protein MITS9508_02041 [Synechococcus sp. MIT S9508]|nr:hypothetical protein MITS9508_02041 [Synechococcus sp. MIT S9508]